MAASPTRGTRPPAAATAATPESSRRRPRSRPASRARKAEPNRPPPRRSTRKAPASPRRREKVSGTDTVEMVHEDALPGHESELEPKPDWEPFYPGSGRLKGKVALVTGADSGIGRAVAALFAREGADIAILYLCEHDDAAKTKAIVEKEGRRAIAIAGDIGDKDFCDRAVAETVDRLGRLDILVNNAGEQHWDEDIREISEAQLKRTFQTNVYGMFFITQAARPHLKEGAAVINCTSVTMYQGSKLLLDYSATKGAITAFTRSLSENLVGEDRKSVV